MEPGAGSDLGPDARDEVRQFGLRSRRLDFRRVSRPPGPSAQGRGGAEKTPEPPLDAGPERLHEPVAKNAAAQQATPREQSPPSSKWPIREGARRNSRLTALENSFYKTASKKLCRQASWNGAS
jgi:hypothetical protein